LKETRRSAMRAPAAQQVFLSITPRNTSPIQDDIRPITHKKPVFQN
jgi:hypothetical protein